MIPRLSKNSRGGGLSEIIMIRLAAERVCQFAGCSIIIWRYAYEQERIRELPQLRREFPGGDRTMSGMRFTDRLIDPSNSKPAGWSSSRHFRHFLIALILLLLPHVPHGFKIFPYRLLLPTSNLVLEAVTRANNNPKPIRC